MEFHSKECLICHKLFFKLSSDSSKYWERKKYCSQDCYGKSLLGRKISLLIKEKMSDTHIRIGSRPPSNGSLGKDHLEHKIPLSRGGTNARENLDIACQHCNNKKFTKTESEYRKELSYA